MRAGTPAPAREDLLSRLLDDLRRDLASAGDAIDTSAAFARLDRLEKLVGLLRGTALQSFGEFERRILDLSLVHRVGSLFSSVFDAGRLGPALAELVEDALPCDGVSLHVLHPSSGQLELRIDTRPEASSHLEAMAERVAASRVPGFAEPDASGAGALLCPIVAQGQTLGVLTVRAAEASTLDEAALRTLGPIADLASVAMRHARLWDEHRRSQVDLERMVDERTRQVNEARAALSRQERVAAMGKLAASIAHEVNNPMSFLVSNLARAAEYAEVLESSLPGLLEATDAARGLPSHDDPRVTRTRSVAQHAHERARSADLARAVREFRELIDETREGADRIRRVGDELRGFAQGVAGVLELVDVNQLLETALHIARAEAKDRVAFECRFGVLPQVRCQRYQITQVLLNLLQNAVEAVEGPGCVRVTTRVVAQCVEIEVSDDGPGIEPLQIERIFEPFYTTKAHGSGLGLSISRDIVIGHHGTLEAAGGPEGGTFRLRLPVS